MVKHILKMHGDEDHLIEPEICGRDWQIDYKKFHDSVMNGAAPRIKRKFLVSVPVRAGGADNMLGIISLFLYALLTNRAFLRTRLSEEGYHAPIMEHAYHPATFNWLAPTGINNNLTFCLWPPYDDMNSRRCDTKPQPFLPTDKYNSTFYPYFFVNSFEENKFWYGDYHHLFCNHEDNADVISAASNRGNVYRAFYNPHHNETLATMGFTKASAFACLYQYLFRSITKVCQGQCFETAERIEHIRKHRSLIAHSHSKEYPIYSHMLIAIQIRDREVDGGLHNVWFHCADQLTQEYYQLDVHNVSYIFINGYREGQLLAQEKYGHTVFYPTGHVTETEISDVLDESNQPNATSKAKEKAILETARDWEIMSLADIHVVSSRSGFGVMGAMLRVRHDNEYRLYHTRDEKRTCLVNEPDDLLIYTDQWSGL
jgi:hypothetical protein